MVATELQEETPLELDPGGATISVVVPSYNHAQFVESALRSIMKQTLPPSQLIVIDDGSTDASPRRIERMLRNCSLPCEFVSRENRGLCATLNEGLERSTGEYFAYLGSDDLWLPDFLKARVDLLASRPAATLGYGHAYFIDEHNRILDSTADWATYADSDARAMLLQTTAPMSPTVLYRRQALEIHRWNEGSKLEDYDLYLRLIAEGEFAFDPRVLSAWRRHSANVSWDQNLMLAEQLRAQREAALRFGLTDKETEKLQTTTKFNRAEDFLRVGKKSQGLRLMMNNWHGIDSSRTTARMLLRLLIPYPIMRWRARARQRKANERYGSIVV